MTRTTTDTPPNKVINMADGLFHKHETEVNYIVKRELNWYQSLNKHYPTSIRGLVNHC